MQESGEISLTPHVPVETPLFLAAPETSEGLLVLSNLEEIP